MLSTNASHGTKPGSLRKIANRASGAPHCLQKLASLTTIG